MPEAADKKIGAKVRHLRKQASVCANDAARICGLELNEYQDSEAGTRRFTSHELFKLCGLLKVTLSDFFGDLQKAD